MKVFKFGGASAASIEKIQNIAFIVEQYKSEQLVIIISAMGKTTNALEKVAEAFFAGKKEEALSLFEVIKNQHLNTLKFLVTVRWQEATQQLNDFFTEIEWLLHDKPVREYDYYYDQIVCVGELLSTAIISQYFNEIGIVNKWIDVRDVIRTDNNFRDAGIDWERTNTAVENLQLNNSNITITQGFIGSTDENESTTLGREGSDYTAAIFANLTNADSLTIWKDVAGVMNADPKEFPDAQLISELSFDEVIEMAYYGAQVIHPKTIKPLQNKGIPLHVKCFLDISLPGTVIHKKHVKNLPPIFVVKPNQALLHLHSKDFSFVGEKPMMQLYEIFARIKNKPNLLQTGAISLQVCLDDTSDKIDQFAAEASLLFDVEVEKGLSLLTIRHYTDDLLDKMIAGKDIVLTQQTKQTVQVLYK